MVKDRQSQRDLYREFYAYGMSICIRYAGNRDEAAEILNDGFIKVFDKIETFQTDRPFKPWLSTILVNTAINYYNKNKKHKNWSSLENGMDTPVEATVIQDLSYNDLVKLVQDLSPQYRTVFNLYVIEGYNHEEIAEMLDISVGTSKSNLFKAKKSLRKTLNSFFLNEKREPIL